MGACCSGQSQAKTRGGRTEDNSPKREELPTATAFKEGSPAEENFDYESTVAPFPACSHSEPLASVVDASNQVKGRIDLECGSNTEGANRASGDIIDTALAEGNTGQDVSEEDAKLATIQDLCRRLELLEAGTALEELESSLQGATPQVRLETSGADAVLQKLRGIHQRFTGMLQNIACPAVRQDSEWSCYQCMDHDISPNYSFDVKVRHADETEFNCDIGGTQLIYAVTIKDFPMELERIVAMELEIDLFPGKKCIKDCDHFSGIPGGPGHLHRAFIHSIMSPRVLPIRIEDAMFREFCVCGTSPLAGLSSAGVLIAEYTAPDNTTEHEGWTIPACVKGVLRLKATRLLYATPSATPGCCNILAMGRSNLPFPRWLVSLQFFKRFVALATNMMFRLIMEHVPRNWNELGYTQRIESNSDLYERIRRLS